MAGLLRGSIGIILLFCSAAGCELVKPNYYSEWLQALRAGDCSLAETFIEDAAQNAEDYRGLHAYFEAKAQMSTYTAVCYAEQGNLAAAQRLALWSRLDGLDDPLSIKVRRNQRAKLHAHGVALPPEYHREPKKPRAVVLEEAIQACPYSLGYEEYASYKQCADVLLEHIERCKSYCPTSGGIDGLARSRCMFDCQGTFDPCNTICSLRF